MKTTYVTLAQAQQLKKLKIDCTPLIEEGIAKAYGKKGDDVNWTTKHFHCWKPSLDYACKWLRENYNIHVTPNANYNADGIIYFCSVVTIKTRFFNNNLLMDEPLTVDYTPPMIFDTYEIAQSAGFDHAIELISKDKLKKINKKNKNGK